MLAAFKSFSVQGADALSSAFVVGYPGWSRINGNIHMICRRLFNYTGISLKINGYMVLHHSGQHRLHGKHRDRMTQKRSVYNGSTPPSKDRSDIYFTPPMISRPQLDLTISLILDCDAKGVQDLKEALHGDPDLLSIITQPNGLGGRVSGCDGVVIESSMPEMLRRLKSGRFLADRTYQLIDADRDPLDVLLDTLEERRPGINPMQIGYKLLGEPSHKVTSRGEGMHAFAEPIIGLVEFIPKSVMSTPEGRSEKIYFKPTIDRTKRLCLVTGFPVPETLLPLPSHTPELETQS